jgi:hypothetical protein
MRLQNPSSWAALFGLLLPAACRGEPAPSMAAAPPAMPASVRALPSAGPSASPSSSSLPSASAAPSGVTPPSAAAANEDPPLLAADGSPLPQTEDRPSVSSERFKRRMQLLADSILTGDAEPGKATFFPLVAYAQVKDVQKPERDYRYRLMANFERDVREYHKALGKQAEQAQFLGASVPEERAQWMKPGKEGNRLGYYRVLRSRLRFRLASGSEKTFELTSMISWRGEWYVVHLNGFE